jgi:ring-1,2-phenylacetyl-CoA epoxidase subunit PaaE
VTAAVFHAVKVAEVRAETDEAVSVRFDVPAALRSTFHYRPGQHVTLRAVIGGEDVRRTYSICANANHGDLRVGIKRLPNGVFSTWATTMLAAGDTIEATPPSGEFTIEPDPDRSRHLAAIAAGSGITPVLSLISTVLEAESRSRFTLVFGNRESRSIMFMDEVEGLKNRYPDRFHLIHVLSREEQVIPLFNGRLDAARIDQLLDILVSVPSVDGWYLCGPFAMVADARRILTERGVGEDRIHDELFFAAPPPPVPPSPDGTDGYATVTFTLEGRRSVVKVDPLGRPILDHALSVRRELPFSCRGGMCATCKARVIEGKVRLDRNWALTQADLDAGYVLTCQAHPLTEAVALDYDV